MCRCHEPAWGLKGSMITRLGSFRVTAPVLREGSRARRWLTLSLCKTRESQAQ